MKKYSILLVYLLFGACSSEKALEELPKFSQFYQLDLTQLKGDKVQVKADIQGVKSDSIVYAFPKMVPGIYGKMDFGQYVSSFKAYNAGGDTLQTKRLSINEWLILDAKQLQKLAYQVDDTWESFDQKQIDEIYRSASSSFAHQVYVINNNSIVGYFQSYEAEPVQMEIIKADSLYGATSLSKEVINTTTDRFTASNYYQLVDNPIMYALPDTAHIKLPNIDVEVACFSNTGKQISKDLAEHIKPLLENQREYLGGKLPVSKYTFILYHYLNDDKYSYVADGLEHSNSTLILFYMPLELNMIKSGIYSIASHEFFHIIMPLGIHSHEIADYNFSSPKLSRHLWLYEGMTEYFTIHMPIKNKLQKLKVFCRVLGDKINESNKFNPDLSLTQMSLNAMDKQDQYYNIYLKGPLVNLCLDIKLRELSDGKYGVQDLVNQLLEKYGPNKSFDDDKFFDEVTSLTGYPEIRTFFTDYVEGTKALPLKETFEKVGLALVSNKTYQVMSMEKLTAKQAQLRQYWIGQ